MMPMTGVKAEQAAETFIETIPPMGLTFKFPAELQEMDAHVFAPLNNPLGTTGLTVMFLFVPDSYYERGQAIMDAEGENGEPTQEELDARMEEIWILYYQLCRALFTVTMIDSEELALTLEGGMTYDDITDIDNSVRIGEGNGYTYLFGRPEMVYDHLDEEEIALLQRYEEVLKDFGTENIEIGEIEMETPSENQLGPVPAFSAVDLDGNPLTNSVFEGVKLTMINFWGTYCGPCINEMPDLGELGRNMPEGTQLVGIIIDGTTPDTLELARSILDGANADFLQIVPDEAIYRYSRGLLGVPSTIFVDSQGKQVGETILGARSYADYLAAIEELLK